MMNKISRCNICGKFFDSKRELKDHIDKNHRITNTKIVQLNGLIAITTTIDWLSEVLPQPHPS
jgi:hypothetical protein